MQLTAIDLLEDSRIMQLFEVRALLAHRSHHADYAYAYRSSCDRMCMRYKREQRKKTRMHPHFHVSSRTAPSSRSSRAVNDLSHCCNRIHVVSVPSALLQNGSSTLSLLQINMNRILVRTLRTAAIRRAKLVDAFPAGAVTHWDLPKPPVPAPKSESIELERSPSKSTTVPIGGSPKPKVAPTTNVNAPQSLDVAISNALSGQSFRRFSQFEPC